MANKNLPAPDSKTNGYPVETWNATNFKYSYNPRSKVECTVLGPSEGGVDKDWEPTPKNIIWISNLSALGAHRRIIQSQDLLPSEENRAKSSNANKIPQYPGQSFLNWTLIEQKFLPFVAYVEFTFSRCLYDSNVPRWPLDLSVELISMGTDSLSELLTFYAPNNGGSPTMLWSIKSQMVTLDKKNRKPSELPKWCRDLFQIPGKLSQGLNFQRFKRPSVTYCHPVHVQASDTDYVGHTNTSSYIGWAMDALNVALNSSEQEPATQNQTASASAEALCWITKETVARGLAKVQASYYKEFVEGDDIDVHVWQDKSEADPGLVWCSLMKAREEICQMKLWHYNDDN